MTRLTFASNAISPSRPSRPIRVKPAVAYLLAIGLIGPAAIFKGNNLLIWMLSIMLSMGLLGTLVSWLSIRGLRVHREVPEWGEVQRPLRVRYSVKRVSAVLPSFGLQVSDALNTDQATMERAAWVMHVGPNEQVYADARLTPTRRGRLSLRTIQVSTSFPFGLFTRRRSVLQQRDIVVYPRRHRLRRGVIQLAGAERLDGPRSGRRRGHGREWYGLRPAGGRDSLRDIAWKVTAHRDELICIDRAAPSLTRIRVVLDVRVATDSLVCGHDRNARDEEERAIELAASLLEQFHLEGCEVGLVVPGLVGSATPIRNSSWHLHRLLSRLADLDLDQPRSAWQDTSMHDRSSCIVVQADRVRPIPHLGNATYLTSGHLEGLLADETAGSGT